ncbi:hypothetical protein NDU88_004740, partial [Pleurodeles waltl]
LTPIKRRTYKRPLQRRCGPWGSIHGIACIAGRGERTSDAGPESQPKSSSPRPPNEAIVCFTLTHLMALILAVAYLEFVGHLRVQQQHQ